MNKQEEIVHRDAIIRAEAGKRLLENGDYGLYVSDLEKDLVDIWKKLATEPTTDPVIAKLQGELEALEKAIGKNSIIRTWIKNSLDISRGIHDNKNESNQEGDYNNG